MNCSHCNEIDESIEIMCENGHYLCVNCYTLSQKRCIQCGGRLIDFDKSLLNRPLSDAVFDWLTYNEHQRAEYAEDSLDGEVSVPQMTDASLDVLFARSKSLDKESSDSKRFGSQNSSKKVAASQVELHEQTEIPSDLDIKDTRQNLLDQTTEELRRQIRDALFSSYKNDPRRLLRPEEFICQKSSKTIGVSTDSEPNLLPTEQTANGSKMEHVVEIVDFSQQSTTVSNQEAPNSQESNDEHFLTILREKLSQLPANKVGEIISSICNPVETEKPENTEEKQRDSLLAANSSRASYSPPSRLQKATIPKPQFQPISKKTKPTSTQIVDAATLSISRCPIICPISSCQQASFVSNFTSHIAIDHSQVPLERMFPRNFKNFFLDPKLMHFGANRCQLLLLVNEKVKNLGHDQFRDFIPVMVMSTKVSASELCSSKSVTRSDSGFLMIWLTGIVTPHEPIFFSLTVWARSGSMSLCHIVHSGQLYSVRNSQNSQIIHESGQMMLLSQNQVDLLTNKGRNMLELQIEIN